MSDIERESLGKRHLPRCANCGIGLLRIPAPLRCPKCRRSLCSPLLRDCLVAHYEIEHKEAAS
jgi:hypothetical protein